MLLWENGLLGGNRERLLKQSLRYKRDEQDGINVLGATIDMYICLWGQQLFRVKSLH